MLGLFKSKKRTDQTKILVVDDDADLVKTIQRRLEYCQWKIVTAGNGKEGLEKAAKEKPDLIVLDIGMPEVDGHEMLKHLRAHQDLRDIPVIMCTKSFEVQDITRAASYNVSDYVTKPFDCAELIERIVGALENRTVA
jgi:CheY-like chemotaxis protein